jgi:signal peptidase I
LIAAALVGGGAVGMGLRPGVVVGDSMSPTLRSGQWFVMDSKAYRRERPQRGDVVVFRHRRLTYVKRVLGAGGDTVCLLVQRDADGVWLSPVEPGMLGRARRLCRRSGGLRLQLVWIRVPPNHIYAIGDMVTRSVDSRHLGPIPLHEITGRVRFGLAPAPQRPLPPIPTAAQHASRATMAVWQAARAQKGGGD